MVMNIRRCTKPSMRMPVAMRFLPLMYDLLLKSGVYMPFVRKSTDDNAKHVVVTII